MKKEKGGHLKTILQSSITESLLSALAAIVIGLLIGFVVLMICNPSQAVGALGTIITGGMGLTGVTSALARICYYGMPLIMCGLSVGFAFKTGTFNIGASGQYWVGAFAAILTAHLLADSCGRFTWVVALLAATAAGGLWALLPGLLNAYRNVNIIISGIMMNYIGTYMVSILIKSFDFLYSAASGSTVGIPEQAILPKTGLDQLLPVLGGSGANIGILIALVTGVIVYIVLNRTTFGFELCTCGANRYAATNAGINGERSIVLAMVIAGALAGLGGGLVYLSSTGVHLTVTDTVNGTGFFGIAVALLGMCNPIGIVIAGLFVSFLQVGGNNLQIFGFSSEFIDVIVAVIIFSCAFAERLRKLYRMLFSRSGLGLRRESIDKEQQGQCVTAEREEEQQ